MDRSEIILRLTDRALTFEGVLALQSALQALPAYERIEVLAIAIGQVGQQLKDKKGLPSRDSSVHVLNSLSLRLAEEFR